MRTYIIDDVLNISADILYVIVKQTMKKNTHYIIVCCMMALVILSFAGFDANANALPRNVTWKQVNTDHFRLLYDERHRDVVQYIAGMVESVHQDMSRFFEFHDEIHTDVILLDHIDSFDRFHLDVVRKSGESVVLHLGDITAGAQSKF